MYQTYTFNPFRQRLIPRLTAMCFALQKKNEPWLGAFANGKQGAMVGRAAVSSPVLSLAAENLPKGDVVVGFDLPWSSLSFFLPGCLLRSFPVCVA